MKSDVRRERMMDCCVWGFINSYFYPMKSSNITTEFLTFIITGFTAEVLHFSSPRNNNI